MHVYIISTWWLLLSDILHFFLLVLTTRNVFFLDNNWVSSCPCSDVRSSPVTRLSLSPSLTTPSTCWLRGDHQTSSWFISSGRKEKWSRAQKLAAASQKFPSIQRTTILSALWAERYFECVVSLKVRGNYCQIER